MSGKNSKLITAGAAVIAAAGAAVAFCGKELYTYAVKRDNSDSIMAKAEKKTAAKDKIMMSDESPEEIQADPTQIDPARYNAFTQGGLQWFMDQNPEEIDLMSYDGLRLHGYFLPPSDPEGNKYMLLMHGYRCASPFDLAHTYRHFYEAGYGLMVPCQRAHGKSEGDTICYGTKERFDVKSWCEYLVGRLGEDIEINMMGISMGAATVLMSTGLELPEQVNKVIADCGFTTPLAEFNECMKAYGLKHYSLLVKAAEAFSKKKSGFGFSDASTLEALKTNTHPILFIHGDQDDFVPTFFTEQNYNACTAPKQVLYVKGAKHATAGMVDPEGYFSAIDEFLAD